MDGGFLLILLLMFGFMYLLLIRPQRQQQRRHAEMVEALKPGDEVITVGGLYGDITEVQADRVSLEISEDVEVEVTKRAIASIVPPEDAVSGDGGGVEPYEEPGEPESLSETDAVPEEDSARR